MSILSDDDNTKSAGIAASLKHPRSPTRFSGVLLML